MGKNKDKISKGILLMCIFLVIVIFIGSKQISFVMVHLSPDDSDLFVGNWNDELNREIDNLTMFMRYTCVFILGFLVNKLILKKSEYLPLKFFKLSHISLRSPIQFSHR